VVEIRGDRFVGPDGSSAIVVQLGQSIQFVNRDDSDHTATSTATPAGGASFDTGGLDTGETATITPNTVGTWRYRCDFHPEMTGTITVTDGSTPPPGGGGGVPPGGTPGGGGGTPPGGTPGGGVGIVVLRITEGGFEAGGHATIALGQSIEWSNDSGEEHEIDSTDEPDHAADFRSGELLPGDRFRFTPDRTGTWVYRCKEHGEEEDMTLTVR
jgi:plastocyanin